MGRKRCAFFVVLSMAFLIGLADSRKQGNSILLSVPFPLSSSYDNTKNLNRKERYSIPPLSHEAEHVRVHGEDAYTSADRS